MSCRAHFFLFFYGLGKVLFFIFIFPPLPPPSFPLPAQVARLRSLPTPMMFRFSPTALVCWSVFQADGGIVEIPVARGPDFAMRAPWLMLLADMAAVPLVPV